MDVVEEYSVLSCTDCVMLVANGDVPEDDEGIVERIEAHWPGVAEPSTCNSFGAVHGSLRWELYSGDIGESGFYKRPCECCGSRLGGERYRLTALLVRR